MEELIITAVIIMALFGLLIGGFSLIVQWTGRFRKYDDYTIEDLKRMEEHYAKWKAGRKRVD